MVDEVRRLEAGRYLGIGTFGFTDAQRRMPYSFRLTGPVAPCRSDIGEERADSEAMRTAESVTAQIVRGPGMDASLQ